MKTLVIVEHDNNSIKGGTFNTVTAASKLSGEITLLIAGSAIDSVISEAQSIDGISNILKCDNDIYSNFIAEDLSALIALSLIHI